MMRIIGFCFDRAQPDLGSVKNQVLLATLGVSEKISTERGIKNVFSS